MARRRLFGAGVPAKISLLLPKELADRIEEIRAARGADLSVVVRELLERALQSEHQQQQQAGPGAGDAGTVRAGLTLHLTAECRDCLQLAAAYLGVALASLAQTIIADHVEEYVERGRQRIEELRRILAGVRGQTGQTPAGGGQE